MAASTRSVVFRVTGLPIGEAEEVATSLKRIITQHLSSPESHQLHYTVSAIPSCDDEHASAALVDFKNGVPGFLNHLVEHPLEDYPVETDDGDINFDRHFFGFTQLYYPEAASPVAADIIAITGLDGHAYGSWRGKGHLGRMWLRDFLSKDLPRCRTMIYGYNSKLLSQGIDTILTYGLEFMECLKSIRNTEELRQRPLIFIAHSFGGIVLAHSIVRAKQADNEDHPAIATLHMATYGILFFATPHKGLIIDDIQSMMAGTQNYTRNILLQQIKHKSDLLISQLADFKNLIRDRKIVSFFEMEQTRRLELDPTTQSWGRTGSYVTAVDTDSATLQLPSQMETQIPLHSDHSQIVKFDSRNTLGYKFALQKLREFVTDAPKVVEKRLYPHLMLAPAIREVTTEMPSDLPLPYSLQASPPPHATHNSQIRSPFVNTSFSGFDGITSRELLQLSEQSRMATAERTRVATASGFISRLDGVKTGPFWVVPYTRNNSFVGRVQLFEDLIARFTVREGSQARVALFGLGGVGKSQIALEYAHRLRQVSPEVSVFWVHAGSFDKFQQGYDAIAKAIDIPGSRDTCASTLGLVKAWLTEKLSGRWLMIIDNADDGDIFFGHAATGSNPSLEHQSQSLWDFMPLSANGSILFTTRNKRLGLDLTGGGDLISIPPMDYAEAEALFKGRLQGANPNKELTKKLFDLLEYLPLAIVQAAASITWKEQTISDYLESYEETESAPLTLLDEDFNELGRDIEGKNAVFKTWVISFDQIRRQNPRAAELLSLMSFCDPQGIPKLFLRRQLGTLGDLENALGILKSFSLIVPSHDGKSVDMHRLVQLCTRGWLRDHNDYSRWVGNATTMLSDVFPHGDHQTWGTCALLLPHAQAILKICPPSVKVLERATLQFNVAWYLDAQGEYESSEQLHRQALDRREQHLGKEHSDTLRSSNGLAVVLWHRGKYEDAEHLHRRTLETRMLILGPDQSDTLTSLSNLSNVLWDERKYGEAEKLNQQALEGRKKAFGPRHKDTMESISNQVVFQWYHGKYMEAEATSQVLVTDMDELLGATHPATLRTKSIFASMLEVLGKYKAAEHLGRQILEARENIYGKDHPETLGSLEMLSCTLECQGKYVDADLIRQRALQGFQTALGKDHPNTIASRLRLAILRQKQGRLAAAEKLMRQVLDMYKNILGENHPTTLICVGWLLYFLELLGKFRAAQEILQPILKKIEVLDDDDLGVLEALTLFASILSWQREYEQAEQIFQRVLQGRKKVLGEDHPDTLTSKNSLANVLQVQRRYNVAEQLYREVLAGRQQVLGEDHPDMLISKNSLATMLKDQRKYNLAERLYRETLAGRQQALGEDHPDTLTSKNNLAVVLQDQRKYNVAEQIYRETLAGRQQALGEDHPNTLTSKNNLAVVLKDQRKYDMAEELYRETLAGRQQALGEDHPNTLTSKNNLAGVLRDQRKYNVAEQLYRETLAGRQQALGEDHPDILTSKNNLANVLKDQRKYDMAEELYRETLAGRQQALGEDHPDTLTSKNNLAVVLQVQRRYDVAEQLYRETLAGRQQALGEDHPDTLTSKNNLADVLRDQRKYDMAEQLYRETLAGRQQALGEDHPDTLTSKNSLADVLRDQRKYDMAEQLYRETLAGRQQALGEDHPDILTSKNDLANVFMDQRRYDMAEELYRETLAGRQQAIGEDHPDTLTSKNNLAVVLQVQRRYDVAEQLYREALAGRQQALGEDHPDTLTSKNSLAVVFQDQKKYVAAELLHREELVGREKVLGNEHPDALTSLDSLSQVLSFLDKDEEAEELCRKALAGRQNVFGEDHLDTLSSYTSLAPFLLGKKDLKEAERLYRKTLLGREKLLGEYDELTLSSVSLVGLVLQVQDQYEAAQQFHQRALTGRLQVLGETDESTLDSMTDLAFVLEKQDQHEEANSLYQLASAARQRDFSNFVNPGWVAKLHQTLRLDFQGVVGAE